MEYSNLIEALESAPGERRFLTMWIDEDDQESVTFGQFRRRAWAMAEEFRQRGVGLGDFVVLIMPQGIAGMSAFAGAMMLGAIPSFLAYPSFKMNPAKYRAGLAGVTDNLHAKLVVIDEEFPEDLLEHIALNDGTVLLRPGGRGEADAATLPLPRVAASHVAFLQHSAGTTGLQKGVALTHEKVLRQLRHLGGVLQVDAERDSVFSWLPLYHDMGLIAGFLLPMVYHLPLVLQSPLDWVMRPQSMLQAIDEHRCTLAWQPNFAFQFLARRTPREQRDSFNLSSLRALVNCSEPVRATSIDEFRQAFAGTGLLPGAISASYAMAENVFAVSQSCVGEAGGPRRIWALQSTFRSDHRVVPVDATTPGAICFVSSGKLLPGTQVRLLAEGGDELAAGYVGEILLRTDCLFEGYWNHPDLTAQAMADGWYRTGDLGFVLEDELYVVGRKKDLLIVAGENLYAQDIEEVVSSDPDIHDGRVIAIGAFNPALGTEEIVVVAELEHEELLGETAVIEQRIRQSVVQALGVAVRTVLLKPPLWVVKSTAGKPSRSASKARLHQEHPEFNFEL